MESASCRDGYCERRESSCAAIEWSEWGSWSRCLVYCEDDIGLRYRKRHLTRRVNAW